VSKRDVVVSAGSGATRTLVSETCIIDYQDDEPQGCSASCPSGTQATGGSCLAQFQIRYNNEVEESRVVPSGSLASETSHYCSTNTDGADGVFDDISRIVAIDVSVHCE